MYLILTIALNALAVYVASRIVPGIQIADIGTLVVVTVVLAVLNALLKPLLVLTLPATILTLGLFLFVLNAVIVLLAAKLVPGFVVDGFWSALLFSLVVSIVGAFLSAMTSTRE